VHDGDRNDVVGIFVGLSWEPCADDSWSEHLSSDGPAQEVHLDNANGYAAVFPREMQGLSTSSGSNVSTISHNKMQLTHLLMLYKY